LIFEASWPTSPNESSSKVPVRMFDVSVYADGGRVLLWNIVTPNYVGATNRIVYGEVPRGFWQMKPDQGRAPKLRAGIPYRISIRGEKGGVGTLEFEVKADK